MLLSPLDTSLSDSFEISGSPVLTRLSLVREKFGAVTRRKHSFQKSVFVVPACVSCLPQTGFQSSFGWPCCVPKCTDWGGLRPTARAATPVLTGLDARHELDDLPSRWLSASSSIRSLCSLPWGRPASLCARATCFKDCAERHFVPPDLGLRPRGWTPRPRSGFALARNRLPARGALGAGVAPPPALRLGALHLLDTGWSARGRASRLAAPPSSFMALGRQFFRRLGKTLACGFALPLPHARFFCRLRSEKFAWLPQTSTLL
jgi:hypothetical protein